MIMKLQTLGRFVSSSTADTRHQARGAYLLQPGEHLEGVALEVGHEVEGAYDGPGAGPGQHPALQPQLGLGLVVQPAEAGEQRGQHGHQHCNHMG